MSAVCSAYPPFLSVPCGQPATLIIGLSRDCTCPHPDATATICDLHIGDLLAEGARCRSCWGDIKISEPVRLRVSEPSR